MIGLLSGPWPGPRLVLAIGLLVATFSACSSSTGPDPSRASYSGVFGAFVDSTLVFGAPLTSFPEFSAIFDEQFVWLELPPRQEWPALTSVTLELGPREPL